MRARDWLDHKDDGLDGFGECASCCGSGEDEPGFDCRDCNGHGERWHR